ncbi:hypothetical protein ACN28E_50240 [Archangium lansingense]|uniref:hypothetical protein n=1 Tax=Archangium lansingense TaxID=2995310 RepID=UPI003B8160D2
MNHILLLALALMLPATGCTSPLLRTSSHTYLKEPPRLTLLGSEEQVAKVIGDLFQSKGLILSRRVAEPSGGTLYIFTGIRSTNMAVARAAYNGLALKEVGSVIYVRLTPGDGITRVDMLGKPAFSGFIACSDQDAEWGLTCNPPTVSDEGWAERHKVTGREEAAVITEFLTALRSRPHDEPGSVFESGRSPEDTPGRIP